MSVLNLDSLLRPSSVAVIGASDRAGSLGRVVMHNLLEGGFDGEIMPVNPRRRRVLGRKCWANVASLPAVPELAVVLVPAPVIPGVLEALGQRGTRAAVVLSAGTGERDETGCSLDERMLEAAQPHGMRLLGPNSLGLLLPNRGLNASFAHTRAPAGSLALVSQSGALCTTLLDWARSRGIGFSHFISLGNALDVDFGDLLDYLASDSHTSGILLYIESIRDARKFMSAARAASRNKPVIAIKAGRVAEGARAAATHTGALAGSDEVFDSAMRRAGMLRVESIEELFAAVVTLARSRPIRGNRMMVLTNGGGPGVLVADALLARGGRLAKLQEKTLAALDGCLPGTWSRDNPVDIIGDSDAARYVSSLRVLLHDNGYDAILVMLVPSAMIDNEQVARAVAGEIGSTRRAVLTCWMGDAAVESAREHFERLGIAHYETPEAAVRAFMQMHEYQANQRFLMETPPAAPEAFLRDRAKASAVITRALSEGREMLTEVEGKAVLAAYGIPVIETRAAHSISEATALARALGWPVALKILSPDISHKSEVGGVVLDIDSPTRLEACADAMLRRVEKARPDARMEGFSVQRMAERHGAHELMAGMTTDPVFGPVLLFGQGGAAVEVVNDKAVAFPPLNLILADELIRRTRVHRMLYGFRDVAPVDMLQLKLCLVRISQMVVDHPRLVELDINPLLASAGGLAALDARMVVRESSSRAGEQLAIRPYPDSEEEHIALHDGTPVLLRPIRPEDEPAHHDFLARTAPRDLYFRFFRAVHHMTHATLARLTQIDYDREMAFIAVMENKQGIPETVGVSRAISSADGSEAEVAIIVRSDLQGRGIGRALMQKTVDYCRRRGMRRLVGHALGENRSMLAMAEAFGFRRRAGEAGLVSLELVLEPREAAPPSGRSSRSDAAE